MQMGIDCLVLEVQTIKRGMKTGIWGMDCLEIEKPSILFSHNHTKEGASDRSIRPRVVIDSSQAL